MTANILLIEDNPGDVRLVKELLAETSPWQFGLETAGRLSTGLEQLISGTFDVVLLDLGLPDSQGLSTFLKLKSEAPLMPVVILTGLKDEEMALKVVQAGAQDYLFKGQMDGSLLARVIRYAIERNKTASEIKSIARFPAENPNPVLRVDKGGTICYANRASTHLLAVWGCQVGQTLPANLRELVSDVMISVKSTQVEIRVDELTYLLVFAPITDVGYTNLYAIDITERKQAEEKLRENEEFSTSLLEASPHPINVVNPDTSLLYVNPALEKLTGYSIEELVGKKTPYPYWLKDKTKDYGQSLREDLLKTGKPIERLLQKKNGEMFWVQMTLAPIKRHGAEHLLGNWVDITERKRAEEALRHAAEEWRATFDSFTDAVSIHDKDFRLVRVNRAFAETFKVDVRDVIGKRCYEIAHGTDSPPPFCPHKQTLESHKPAKSEFYEPTLGIHLEVSTSPIINDKGELLGSVHLARDITERRKMEAQLILTDRLASIGELAAGIAHELNNPLTSVIGFSQLLMERELPADVKEDLDMINREAQRTARVVKGLLTFARKHELTKQPVNVNDIIDNVLELRAYEQKVNNIEVVRHFMPDVPEIMGDYFQLQQVFLNIIINAEYFMIETHGKGTLTITTERIGDMVRITLADDGPGMSEETAKRIFTPFYTTKPVGKGTGLGLSICHGIVSGHGGKIYARSKPGEGATFIMELPVSTS